MIAANAGEWCNGPRTIAACRWRDGTPAYEANGDSTLPPASTERPVRRKKAKRSQLHELDEEQIPDVLALMAESED